MFYQIQMSIFSIYLHKNSPNLYDNASDLYILSLFSEFISREDRKHMYNCEHVFWAVIAFVGFHRSAILTTSFMKTRFQLLIKGLISSEFLFLNFSSFRNAPSYVGFFFICKPVQWFTSNFTGCFTEFLAMQF